LRRSEAVVAAISRFTRVRSFRAYIALDLRCIQTR